METTDRAQRYVVDASVVSKWHLRDEQYVDLADENLFAFQAGRIDLVAPDHPRYEVPSAIRKGVRTGRLTSDQARTAISDFLNWRLPTVGDEGLILAAYDQTVRFGCSFYDGLYLALCESIGCSLVHADDRLRNALGIRFPLAIWIEDWAPQHDGSPE
jgi:predicted nucleic acid-binding protein